MHATTALHTADDGMAYSSKFPVHDACPICQCPENKRSFVVDGFDIVRCSGCSLTFVLQRLSPEQLSPYYSESPPDIVYTDPANIENLNHYFGKLKKYIEANLPEK